MAIKVLKDAGFTKDDHILVVVRQGSEVLGYERVRDENGNFVDFTGVSPIPVILDAIRCSHNADIVNGNNLGRMLPKTDEVIAALARTYNVSQYI